MARIPLQRLHHANVVVNDLRTSACNYARLLGIAHWDVHHWSPDRLTATQAYGYQAEFGYSTATGTNVHGVTFRLVHPTHGFSTYTEYLIGRGESVHSLCLGQLDTLPAEHGLPIAQSATLQDGSTSVLLDTRQPLGGFYVELATPGAAAEDEHWDLSAEVQLPANVDWLARIPRIGHFGIAVSSVMDRLPHYAELLGVTRWSGAHFHAAPGSLDHSTYRGQAVDNAWLLAITDVADFGLEVLQETRGPTDYQHTIERVGEGIHHALIRRDLSDADWYALRDWMAAMDIGVVMSGQVRSGAAEFFYLDTRAALGFLLELIVTRDVSAGAPAMRRFDLDFSRHA